MSTQSGVNAVQLRYNGVVFENEVKTDQLTLRTPCPLVSISTESNKDVDNDILYDRNTITLEGIILSSGKTDFLTKAYTGVVGFFSDKEKQNSLFEIVCGTRIGQTFTPADGGFIQFSGTSFVSANADKSTDNWFLTIPYTVVLESINSKTYGDMLIESYEDNWTIEPLEDISYFNIFSDRINTYDIKSNVTYGSLVDPGPQGLRSNTAPSVQLLTSPSSPKRQTIENHLQYRITHRVSAVGKPTKIFDPNNPKPGGNAKTTNNKISAYENAARWVSQRVDNSIKMIKSNTEMLAYNNPPLGIKPTGIILGAKKDVQFPNVASNSPLSNGLFLYNHIRSIESSPGAGSYGVTDTWLALGTGVRYTEEFTWEVSVDDRWVHTVTMNGTIKGLETVGGSTTEINPQSVHGYTMATKQPRVESISATGTIVGNEGEPKTPYIITSKFPNQNRGSSKYENALQAYVTGIKPFLYVRAGHALYTVKDPPLQDGEAVPYSPYVTYSKTWFGPAQRPLNIVPTTVNETFNPLAGTISYTVSYDNRPACLLSGALNASVTINDTNSADIVAEAFVLGRPLGPVIEKVGTSKSERQLTIEALYPMPTGFQSLHPQSPQCVIYHTKDQSSTEYKAIENLVRAFKPVGPVAFQTFGSTTPYHISTQGQVFKTADTENWSPFEGRYTRNVTWIYNTGNCV